MIAIGVPAEDKDEPRIGLTPETVKKLVKAGASVTLRSGAGLRSHFSDDEYKAAGAKIAKSDAHNLLERLQKHETSVLLFAKNPQVAFTNNRAERDLSMAKVKQKVSGCFRAEIYAQAYCRISSYLQTMANKGHNPLIAIQMALAGEFDW